ncbi:inovirus Gp2 family protein [Klebsiella quasipneumoniae subsp. similipneumoniae]|uniref:inovirus Gp2 family protein n=1 Tax=Klebsiella pneumoniae complex TaxID=3390273 RepID=UPI00124A630B|nr:MULTISPECIES: inovirus Gp2 family protein [Klebsiella]EKV3465996.1 inovirus Gp2 family protein [Klebsiella pneumoniae]KAA6132107.1 inovirus Gp2 family protein [Klebsiella pneumoniae subsp. pneumoniae]MBD7787431.1 inovirus Gp2 family protein [Klebsiella pneumoniae]MBG2001983.1 inovirus Gp2 family protein [Klebsiella pneumoniae]MBG2067081.1 inovirus Gp2 family protein [Klebsiella pneumoniae]
MESQYSLTNEEIDDLVEIASRKYRSPIDLNILNPLLNMVYGTLEQNNRILGIRSDLRFAQSHVPGEPDLPLCFQREDSQAITRFFESLKSQLRADHNRSRRPGNPTFPSYGWCRERDSSVHPHYHLALLFNADVYGYLGNYQDSDADNMATRIQKAWCSAIGLAYEDYSTLAEFPPNAVYRFSRFDALDRTLTYWRFMIRLAYLAKARTKDIYSNNHNFGTSQCFRLGGLTC